MLLPIDASNCGYAFDLLGRGFPLSTRKFWENAVERLSCSGGNAEAAVPIGYLMTANEKPVGVMLTPSSIRRHSDRQEQRIINLSAWYMEPEHRWRAPVMLRNILKDRGAIFTDLTPSPSVQLMLPALGFRPISRGTAIYVAPFAAMAGPAHSRLVDIDDVAQSAIAQETRALLLSQHAFGCFSAAFTLNGTVHPLQFKAWRWRGIPVAQLIYCESNSAVIANIGAVGRYLVRRRRPLLLMDVPLRGKVGGFKRRSSGIRFAKGGTFDDRTDHIGSELSLFDW